MLSEAGATTVGQAAAELGSGLLVCWELAANWLLVCWEVAANCLLEWGYGYLLDSKTFIY